MLIGWVLPDYSLCSVLLLWVLAVVLPTNWLDDGSLLTAFFAYWLAALPADVGFPIMYLNLN